MATYGWIFDAKRCIECKACEAACKQWNHVETGVNIRYRVVRISETGKFPQVSTQAYSGACNHCEDALCQKACPVKAITRRPYGAVLIDATLCVGCGSCRRFCPYLAPQWNARDRRMEKCTMCHDRIDQGLKPACVTLCPTGALDWGEWERIRTRGADRISGFANPATTRPRIRFVDGWAGK